MAVEKEQEGHKEEWREGMEGEMRQLYYNLKKKNNKKIKKKKMILQMWEAIRLPPPDSGALFLHTKEWLLFLQTSLPVTCQTIL